MLTTPPIRPWMGTTTSVGSGEYQRRVGRFYKPGPRILVPPRRWNIPGTSLFSMYLENMEGEMFQASLGAGFGAQEYGLCASIKVAIA